jgi:hypothetical protein
MLEFLQIGSRFTFIYIESFKLVSDLFYVFKTIKELSLVKVSD